MEKGRQTNMKPKHFDALWIAPAIVLGFSLAAVEFYSMRELAAALIIFSVLFGVIGTVVLCLILIQEMSLRAVAQIEARVAHRHGAPAAKTP